MTRRVIRANGATELLPNKITSEKAAQLIGASYLDTVPLRHLGSPLQVMFVDDAGHEKGLPVNPAATRLYLANCHPGTNHRIRGDVVVVFDEDFV